MGHRGWTEGRRGTLTARLRGGGVGMAAGGLGGAVAAAVVQLGALNRTDNSLEASAACK